jgi:hypothetical protein
MEKGKKGQRRERNRGRDERLYPISEEQFTELVLPII